MGFSELMTFVFGVIFIIILYFIIYYALKIMYKDVKGGGRRRRPSSAIRNFGIEVLSAGDNSDLEEGSVLLLNDSLTIGRKEGNTIRLTDQYVSGSHAKIIVKNNEIEVEDLNSTNGVFVNEGKVKGRCKIKANDKIRIGSATFRVIRADKK